MADVDTMGEGEAMERLAEVNEVRPQHGGCPRCSSAEVLHAGRLLTPPWTPDISRTVDKLVEVTSLSRNRLGKQAFGLSTNGSLMAGVFQRLLINFDAADSFVPSFSTSQMSASMCPCAKAMVTALGDRKVCAEGIMTWYPNY